MYVFSEILEDMEKRKITLQNIQQKLVLLISISLKIFPQHHKEPQSPPSPNFLTKLLHPPSSNPFLVLFCPSGSGLMPCVT